MFKLKPFSNFRLSRSTFAFNFVHYYYLLLTIVTFTNLLLHGRLLLLFNKLYCTVLYCSVLYRTVLYRTVLYCTVLNGNDDDDDDDDDACC